MSSERTLDKIEEELINTEDPDRRIEFVTISSSSCVWMTSTEILDVTSIRCTEAEENAYKSSNILFMKKLEPNFDSASKYRDSG